MKTNNIDEMVDNYLEFKKSDLDVLVEKEVEKKLDGKKKDDSDSDLWDENSLAGCLKTFKKEGFTDKAKLSGMVKRAVEICKEKKDRVTKDCVCGTLKRFFSK